MIGLCCISIINAVVVLKLFYYGRFDQPIPNWVKLAVKYLAPMVCKQQIGYEDDREETKQVNRKPNEPPDYGTIEKDEEILEARLDANGFYIDDDGPKNEVTRKSRRATDWQNVALIWDKFMMIVMTLTTCTSLTIVIFLYVAEITRDNLDLEPDKKTRLDMLESKCDPGQI